MARYYNIKIDQNVTNFNDGAVILHGEIKKLHTWERNLFIDELRLKGYNDNQISKMLHISKQALKSLAKGINRKESDVKV